MKHSAICVSIFPIDCITCYGVYFTSFNALNNAKEYEVVIKNHSFLEIFFFLIKITTFVALKYTWSLTFKTNSLFLL